MPAPAGDASRDAAAAARAEARAAAKAKAKADAEKAEAMELSATRAFGSGRLKKNQETTLETVFQSNRCALARFVACCFP